MLASIRSLPVALALSVAVATPIVGQSVIVTAVGTDLVFGGAGQPAASARLGRVSRVAIDPSGRLVFSDPNFHLVFRVEVNGSISVIAGNNTQGLAGTLGFGLGQSGGGYSGDEGPATTAALNRPGGVAYDPAGNLYIADVFNNRIRMVDTAGIIHTFAGNGNGSFSGDNGPAASASFSFPTDVLVDGSGSVYVNDHQNYRIRKITRGVVSTVAGNGTSGSPGEGVPAAISPLGDIQAIAMDAQGNLYLGDFTDYRVRRISGGNISTYAGGGSSSSDVGSALSVSFSGPGGLAFDQNQNLLIADTANRRILKLAGGVISAIAGTGQPGFAGDGGSAVNASLHNPFGLAVTPGGTIYIADRDNFRIRSINSAGTISTAAGNGLLISSQNGVAANLATLLDPFGVSFDSAGAMLIADSDNNIIRRMTGGTLATIAGTGAQESRSETAAGDSGLATQAGLNGPFSVNADASGNLYEAEANSGSVQKIGTSGLISTIASTSANGLNVPTQAVPDSSGDVYISDLDNSRVLRLAPNGSITQVSNLSNPGGIALDGLGNLYVAEAGAAKVVRVSSTGAMTTIAGGGSIAGAAADGGLATYAQLGTPTGIVVDPAGSVYFSDASNASVRKVSLNGTISTVAGNGHSGFSGDGGPATGASLGEPWGLALDSGGSLYIADVLNNRIRKVLLTSSPSFTVDQSALSLTAASNGKITDPATLTLSSSLQGLLFSVSTDQPWLAATPSSGSTLSSVQVTADPTGMNLGMNTGHVTITALGANPSAISVTVTFTVKSAMPATLLSDTYVLSYSFVTGASPVTSQVSIRNSGSGSLSYSISSSLSSGTGWLSVSPVTGSATANSPGFASVTITPAQLAAGTYTGALTLMGGTNSTPVQIPVSVSVTSPAPKLFITQQGLTFPAIQGGGSPLSQSFGVLNTGTGSMSWTAAVTNATPWLSVSPGSGAVITPFIDASRVTVTVNPSGLGVGSYYGLVSVSAPGNLTQNVTVALNVQTSGSGANVYPAGLVFTPPAQGTNPSSQSVSIANLSSQPLTFTSSRLTGQNWFVQTPSTGVIAPNQTATIVVQPDFSSLQAGTSGSIALQFSDGSQATVSLLAVIPSSPLTAAAETPGGQEKPASTCGSPGVVNVTLVNPQPFNVVLGQGAPIQVKLTDNCGLVTGGNRANANAVFGNGDPTVNFSVDQTQPGSGIWTSQWTPIGTSEGKTIEFIVTATETNATKPNQPTFSASVVTAATSAPVVAAVVQNAASFVPGAISPGGLVTIYGANLGNSATSQPPPYPTTLGNMQVLLNDTPAGTALPLVYVSSGQVTAQISPDLPMLNTSYQITVKVGDSPATYSVAIPVNATAATPAIFTESQNGKGQGAILNVAYQLVDSSNPASPGDAIQIFCTGLGVVSPEVQAGQPASTTILSYTVNPVTVTIGGLPATVFFQGLAPGYAGLYQVNAYVPSGIASGNQEVVLSAVGQSSPAGVTIAVK